MPLYWLTARDGSANFKCEARDAGQAFELMARSLKYNSFAALSADLGYTPGDFEVANIGFEDAEYDEAGNRRKINQERDNLVSNAFKHLRRIAR